MQILFLSWIQLYRMGRCSVRRFEGRTFLVTGATSGIGLATARQLAEDGATVICAARKKDRLDQVVAQLPGEGHLSLAFDAGREEEVTTAGNMLKNANRILHGAVMCAGQHSLRPLQLSKASHFEELFAANVLSALLCTKMMVRLAAKEGASIVWVSSAAALIGNPCEAAYAASKGALIAACRSMATELAPKRIRVNTVAPGVVETPMSAQWLSLMQPEQLEAIRARHLLGFGSPDDVAATITFLASDESRWITGTCLTVDGGLTCH
jgi:NAD(P)-dependent dehydrogenase (short-subunit alcohol dehydrogenase family)